MPDSRSSKERRPWNCVQLVVLLRISGPLEHVQHALRDGEASTDVDGRRRHRSGSQHLKPIFESLSILARLGMQCQKCECLDFGIQTHKVLCTFYVHRSLTVSTGVFSRRIDHRALAVQELWLSCRIANKKTAFSLLALSRQTGTLFAVLQCTRCLRNVECPMTESHPPARNFQKPSIQH